MATHNGAATGGAGNNGHHGGHHGPREGLYVPFHTQSEVVQDLVGKHDKPSDKWWSGVAAGGILLVLGLIGFALRLSDGVSDRVVWGYFAMMFAFVLTTAQAAPMVAIAPRIANGHWRRPISRAAEIWTAVGLFNMILLIPMLWILPPLSEGRRTLWFGQSEEWNYFSTLFHMPAYDYVPHIMATLAMLALVVTGLFLLWLSATPDLALIRDNGPEGWRKRWATKLSRNWIGSSGQWNMLHHRMGILGALYFMMLIFVHFLISVDFLMALVPGWIDALFPITHAANALQAGVATVILTMIVLRQWGGYKDYITLEQFWGVSKLLFALSLLWFWFWFSSFNVLWYGKKPNEQGALELIMVGPYLPVFIAVFVLCFAAPLFVMMWNVVRKSIWGPTIMSVSVLLGTLLDRLRLYVSAYSAQVDKIKDSNLTHHYIHLDESGRLPLALRDAYIPFMEDNPVGKAWFIPEILIVLGVIGGSVLVYLLFARLIPPVNIWEQKELMLYKMHKAYHRTQVFVLGKPR